MDKKTFSLICAIITSILWGSAFVAQDMGMDFIGPHTFNVGRFLVGFLTLLPFFFIFEFKKINLKKINKKKVAYFLFFLGFILAVGQELQQISLIYTDVANTGVFTVFYVLVVPVISYFVFSKKMHWSIWPAVLICLVGGLLLSELKNTSVRLGDSLGILSAFCWGVHILLIRKTIDFFNYPITIAMSQCLVAFLILMPPMYFFEDPSISNILKDSYEIIYVGVLSSGLAFLLQTYSLQNISPAPAAIVFSLEGVFAAIFAWLILDQFLNEIKILGIFLILSAVIFSQLMPIYDKKKYG
ncbi:DMT family transporter [Candidatus Pelagibacter bacterium]|jgi:drug/metabolite transporter (DMT)-like permease|nr:DMT family transporter [Candidatus Pelagibacter bacterium]MDA8772363.1 DMT family transporter [Candidatus Pelagibacter bacterium]MDC0858553.1 DMT family transporter [Pelagibacteraceae bacterium]